MSLDQHKRQQNCRLHLLNVITDKCSTVDNNQSFLFILKCFSGQRVIYGCMNVYHLAHFAAVMVFIFL